MKVPQYGGNEVQSARLPDTGPLPKASAETFGGGAGNVAAGLSDIARVTDKIYRAEKEKADDLAVQEAINQATKLETDLMYSPNGAMNKKGKDAFGQISYVSDEYFKKSQEIADTLNNAEQKAKFKKTNDARYLSIDRSLNNHVANEIIRHENNVATALIDNEANAAALAYKDMYRVSSAIQTQSEVLERLAKVNGWSEDELKNKKDSIIAKTHAGVINSMLVNDQELGAEEYFRANREFIADADVLSRVEQQLEVGSLRKKSQMSVDDYMSRGLTESQALKESRQIEDAKLRETVEGRIRNQYGMREQAKRQDLENISISTMNMIDQGKVTDLTKTPGWSAMNDSTRRSLQSYLNDKVSGKATETDINTYYDLKTMASTPGLQDKFLQADLTEYRSKLSNNDFKKMIDLQSGMRKGDSKAQKEVDGFRTDAQIVRDAYEAAGYKASDKKAFNQFKSMVETAQIAEQERTGKKLNNKQMSEIANNLLLEVVTKEGIFFDDKKKMFELDNEEVKTIKYKDVPSADKIKIEKALKESGKPVTEDNVRQLYIKKVLRGRE